MQRLTQHETAAVLKNEEKTTNGKVVLVHIMYAYVENAGTVALILKSGSSGDESSNSRTCRFSAGKERQSELEARWAPEPVRTFL
jgi:hypothetical protein